LGTDVTVAVGPVLDVDFDDGTLLQADDPTTSMATANRAKAV
jgi:hypothetical protein